MKTILIAFTTALLFISCGENELEKQRKIRIDDSLRQTKLNDSLETVLAAILKKDQDWRELIDSVKTEAQRDSLSRNGTISDSLNLVEVKKIIDRFGWPDKTQLKVGNETIFFVVQHSDLSTQEKYLPLMKKAVELKKIKAGSLALLIDRIAASKGEDQIYGSQLSGWSNGKESGYFLLPLKDPDNVDKRRAEMGLEPIADYLKLFGVKWDVEQYKKEVAEYKKQMGKK